MTRLRRLLPALVLTLALSACFDVSVADIMTLANNADDIHDVEAEFGEPDRIVNYGLQNDWEYSASDGRVAITVEGTTIVKVRKER